MNYYNTDTFHVVFIYIYLDDAPAVFNGAHESVDGSHAGQGVF